MAVFFPIGRKSPVGQGGQRNGQDGADGHHVEPVSTRRMIRALRRGERLTDAHAALPTLALTTARALGDVVASTERRYVVAQLARAHLLALGLIVTLPEPETPDAIDAFLAELLRPTPGTGAMYGTTDGRM
jgi:hypothetical protein